MKRLYELGSKAIHPRIGDMVETEELGWSADSKECMDLILMALTSLTAFGLSRYSLQNLKNSRPRRQSQQENLEYSRSLYI